MTSTTAPSSKAVSTKPAIWPFFAVGLILIGLFFMVNQWLVSGSGSDPEPEEAARSAARVKNLAELHAENAKQLETYAWVDRAKGTVQIPIKAAMQQIIPMLNQSQPRPAYPVVPPAAVAPATPAPAAPPAPQP
jgi:hypothetical protein